MLPIIADGEAGFGGPLNVFELLKNLLKLEQQEYILKIVGKWKNVAIWVASIGTDKYNDKKFEGARLASDIADVPL